MPLPAIWNEGAPGPQSRNLPVLSVRVRVEGPVEYGLPGTEQVHEEIGMGFAQALRAFAVHCRAVIERILGSLKDEHVTNSTSFSSSSIESCSRLDRKVIRSAMQYLQRKSQRPVTEKSRYAHSCRKALHEFGRQAA